MLQSKITVMRTTEWMEKIIKPKWKKIDAWKILVILLWVKYFMCSLKLKSMT